MCTYVNNVVYSLRHSRVAVGQLVVPLVCLHGQLQVALLTSEACLVPHLGRERERGKF